MSGVKGRSGRKPKFVNRLECKNIADGVVYVMRYLSDPNYSDKEKAEYIQPFMLKKMELFGNQVKSSEIPLDEKIKLALEFFTNEDTPTIINA